jgi:hypothetical protein
MFSGTEAKPVYSGLLTSVLAIASAGLAGPAHASTAYDGNWSVVINTRAGSCTPSVRYGVAIVNGRVISASGGQTNVNGQVTPRGAVTVTVQAGNASATGSGRLGQVTGTGVWTGEGSMGSCEGTWVAQRSGYNTGAPVYNSYNYVPQRSYTYVPRSYSYYNYAPQPYSYYNYTPQPYSYYTYAPQPYAYYGYGYGWQR